MPRNRVAEKLGDLGEMFFATKPDKGAERGGYLSFIGAASRFTPSPATITASSPIRETTATGSRRGRFRRTTAGSTAESGAARFLEEEEGEDMLEGRVGGREKVGGREGEVEK